MTLAIEIPQIAIAAPNSKGFSAIAGYITEQLAQNLYQLNTTFTFGLAKMQILGEVRQVYEECRTPNWDGYGAEAVSLETCLLTNQLLASLPLGFPIPTVGAEPDGHLTLEWHRSPNRTISLSISPASEIHYAALIGTNRAYGTEYFIGELPKTILDQIKRVLA